MGQPNVSYRWDCFIGASCNIPLPTIFVDCGHPLLAMLLKDIHELRLLMHKPSKLAIQSAKTEFEGLEKAKIEIST